ncbi:HD-GYP domain-containing protein (c-di-GMP phosphodiesterase class II) [Salirhabdus euzebyi]|uniref:HD-GYP domain-containing protein (C-di-GMP phosphodiesterase class II) n=1 Tax=Salirhabdus euzebyi TaxID=394506 RepID=A0A841Q7Q9_9BACI|nr:HD-GYP domain-containing protein [Salirhabdus euzebyi]MBB6454415.1 HD-GYP domain-containing protein (c-di-GMP phosphodiesterase class II) [Salirhabdus euzebyi]
MGFHPSQLKQGCIITRDVMGKTMNPIIPKDTVITPLHIEILNHFMVEEVEVATTLISGKEFKPEQKEEDEIQKTVVGVHSKSFLELYLHSVKETKQLFQNWQARNPVDILEVRKHLLPLLKKADEMENIVFSLHHFVEKEEYTHHHSVAKALISAFLAKKLRFPEGERIQIALAAYLSDSGMALLDDSLLDKKASLTLEEFEQVKKHPIYSYRLVENISMIKYDAKIAILQHHERLDGSGYPFGLQLNKIHQYARILAISDIFHAMTSERFYKSKQSPFKVLEEMLHQQFGKLDIEIVTILVRSLTNLSNGTKVRLSDQTTGEIVFIDQKFPTRPIIRLDHNNNMISLIDHKSIYIDEVLN